MQVNSINNNYSGTNFCACYIKPEAVQDVAKAPMSKLKSIESAVIACADSVGVDLEICRGVVPRVKTSFANSYVPPMNPREPRDEFLVVDTIWDGTEGLGNKKGDAYVATLDMGTKEAAMKAYSSMKATISDIDRAREFTLAISERNKYRAGVEIAEQKAEAERRSFAEGLIDKYLEK